MSPSALAIRKDVSRQRHFLLTESRITKLPRYSKEGKPLNLGPYLIH